jgi:hypothetical protein
MLGVPSEIKNVCANEDQQQFSGMDWTGPY